MNDYLLSLTQKSVNRQITAGSTILYQGEVPRSACVIVEGIVRVYSISSQGEEQTVAYLVDGEFFPASWLFGKATSTLFFYEAVSNCRIAYVKKDLFTAFIYADIERTKKVLDYFASSYAGSLLRINALEQSRARDKLVYTLLFLCQRYGVERDGKMYIKIALTHQNIANLVGLTRETTAAEMSKLKKQAIVSYKQQHYTINKAKLLAVIGEDSFSDAVL